MNCYLHLSFINIIIMAVVVTATLVIIIVNVQYATLHINIFTRKVTISQVHSN